MVVWSSTFRALGQNIIKYRGISAIKIQNNDVRSMSDHGPRIFPLQPSMWQFKRFKDLFHFYVMLGVIPIVIIMLGSSIFVGPATLQETPEGYEPKHWEYHRKPVCRFYARYLWPSRQQQYEKHLHAIWEESEKMKIRELEAKVKALMEERRDYQAWYYRPALAKYHRKSREVREQLDSIYGD